MKLILSPVRRDTQLTLERAGDVLTINGEVFDFSDLPEGATLPETAIDSDWFAGPVERTDGALRIHLILPHGVHAPTETLFPRPLTLTGDGPVALPPRSLKETAA